MPRITRRSSTECCLPVETYAPAKVEALYEQAEDRQKEGPLSKLLKQCQTFAGDAAQECGNHLKGLFESAYQEMEAAQKRLQLPQTFCVALLGEAAGVPATHTRIEYRFISHVGHSISGGLEIIFLPYLVMV